MEVMRGEKATIVEQSMQDKDSLMAAMHDFENQVTELRKMKANAEQQVVHLTSRCAELESDNVKCLQARDNAEALARGEIKLLHEQLERSERERQASLEVQREMQQMDEEMSIIHARLTSKLKEREEAHHLCEDELGHLKTEHAAALEKQKELQRRLRLSISEREGEEAAVRDTVRRLKEQLQASEEEAYQAKHAHQVAIQRAEEEMEQMAADLMRAEERAKVAEAEKAEDAARFKDETARLAEALRVAEKFGHDAERELVKLRDIHQRTCEKHAEEMHDINDRMMRERERLQGVAAELDQQVKAAKDEKARIEATARETIDRLKDELRTAEEAVYRTERELFHGVEQIKELQDSHARQLQDEQRAKDNLAHELGEIRQRFDALEHAKVEAEQQFHEKERVLQVKLMTQHSPPPLSPRTQPRNRGIGLLVRLPQCHGKAFR